MVANRNEKWIQAEIVDTSLIAEDIKRIRLQVSHVISAPAGSHIKVATGSNNTADIRSYSIAETNKKGTELDIAVLKTRNSRGGSLFMHSLEPGQTMKITEPLQDFPLRIGAPKYLLVAGGIGITPIVNMANVLRNLEANYEIHYCARSPKAMAFYEDLKEGHGERVKFYFDSYDQYIDLNNLTSDLATGTELYMCGPIRLMEAIKRSWLENGNDPTNLRYETFGNSGWFEAQQFYAHIPRLNKSISVGENETLLDALQREGIDMVYDCQRGECGLCQVDILEVDGEIDHRDVFLSESQKKINKKMCSCVSRAVKSDSISKARIVLDVS
ncbi:2Fe-2S iron-sulfur cluster binding domain-containing protein [Corynebacterium poyangense]|uniref:2Fe-2S iron-sulfur cluster binding domain-containing protein n=1 Tax=Corynebacterium poyangense TaxID=2684405 RepID=A0A7H0SQE7_9CORY|nr:PDR/VanB family oxidoreductase [Corynebacterium poyangense]MBZ8178344.1 2Fe-2S iron-sulfur cluster binding domain-containing protein [Corynebacterium poyangense]QNQ90772.1 2Fe-2S iron-sulfur cluster binding domain-containing protein [Corynebacterium poyangense]